MAAGSGGRSPRPAFNAFHRQHQAERNLHVSGVGYALGGADQQCRDVPPSLLGPVVGWQMPLDERAGVRERGDGHDLRDDDRVRQSPGPVGPGRGGIFTQNAAFLALRFERALSWPTGCVAAPGCLTVQESTRFLRMPSPLRINVTADVVRLNRGAWAVAAYRNAGPNNLKSPYPRNPIHAKFTTTAVRRPASGQLR